VRIFAKRYNFHVKHQNTKELRANRVLFYPPKIAEKPGITSNDAAPGFFLFKEKGGGITSAA